MVNHGRTSLGFHTGRNSGGSIELLDWQLGYAWVACGSILELECVATNIGVCCAVLCCAELTLSAAAPVGPRKVTLRALKPAV